MNTWPSIYREGALALSPNDVAKGNGEIDALIESAAWSIARRENLSTILYALSAAALIVGSLGYLIYSHRKPPAPLVSNGLLILALLAAAMLAATWWGWTVIQNGRMGQRLGKLSGVTIPPPLQELIDSFASGVREVRTSRGDTVPPSLFASRWAIMLFSHDPRQRLWVRGPRGERHRPQIFADPGQPKIALPADTILPHDAAEALLRNFDPAMAWLVDDTAQRFAAGLDEFLDTLPPHQVDAYRLILTVARRELRKGGQPGAQEAAIRIILAELENEGRLIRGTSRATIMKLIHGQHRGKDIRGYFA